MRGQAAIAVAAVILLTTLILLVALPKRTLGPEIFIEDDVIEKREIEHMLRNTIEEAIYATALDYDAIKGEDLAKALNKSIELFFLQKAAEYAMIRGVRCEITKTYISSKTSDVIYINETYVEVSCWKGKTRQVAFVHSTAKATVEYKHLGLFNGIKAKVSLKRGDTPITLINYAAVFQTKENSATKVYPALGGLSPRDAIWYFNITNNHEIKIGVPPELADNPSCKVIIVATSVGEGAGTIIVANCKAPIQPQSGGQ